MNQETKDLLLFIQQDEIDGYHIYTLLSNKQKIEKNKQILAKIAGEENGHYAKIKRLTGQDVSPRMERVYFYTFISSILGLTFGLKLMENGERQAENIYSHLQKEFPEIEQILRDEEQHERDLIDMLKESKLNYMGSVVLGLNDALVELTWALAWFTFAIQNSRTIALIGLITGISASFSMAASEFLSQRQETGNTKEAIISSIYTGIAYIATVILLTLPFLFISHPFMALGTTIAVALAIIAFFNFYISVAKDYNFKHRFLEMAVISLWVAAISFGIWWFVKTFLGLDI